MAIAVIAMFDAIVKLKIRCLLNWLAS
jgi:hypothetical protein